MGNLDSKRDWGHAKDYVEMQWLMLQQKEPEDYVIATGRMETVRRFIELTAKELQWNTQGDSSAILWEGKGVNEIGRRADTKEIVIKIDQRYFRPSEVDELLGDSSKAYQKLGWEPKTNLEDLIKEMTKHDLKEAGKEKLLMEKGYILEKNKN